MENVELKPQKSQIKAPHHIPMSIYIYEADTLYHWAQEDKNALAAAGLSMDVLESLPNLSDAATAAEAEWYVQLNSVKESVLEWEKQAAIGYELRKQLLHHFRFAFRGQPHLLAYLRVISKGESHAKKIQDLNDLAVLGRANRVKLEAILFDMSLLDKAAQASFDLAMLLADATRDRRRPNEAKDIRDLAYSRLKEVVDKVRFYGRYVFRGNKERLIGYRSEYMRHLKNKQARKRKKNLAGKNGESVVVDSPS
ncbi:MAG: hypothetical protein QG657_3066 [Acidobacteriota bacterium]|nr:hypothetical protein [Acidobacteriota bacterium]